MADPLGPVIAAQQQLIAALDARVAEDIVAASQKLADALAAMDCRLGPETRDSVNHALRQCDAARMRINILSAWNRQRIDRLSDLRGHNPRPAYSKP